MNIILLFTLIISLICQILIKKINKKIIILSIACIGYLITMLTIFNSEFLRWCLMYTFILLIGNLLADLILKYRKNLLR